MHDPQSQQSAESSQPVRPLPVLRAHIDAVDHELLHLLARRNALITEVADYKRRHTVPIRDFKREREILTDRRERATPLGLPPDLIESMFRLILWGSRDRQAALRAEVPLDVEPKTVAIIGGCGAMGRCMATLFADLGHAVIVADVQTATSPVDAAKVADVVVVSVPIESTVEVVRSVGPCVRTDALLMDVTSVKVDPVEAMLDSSKCEVVGTHPLFGPSVHSLQGQRVVICPARGEQWLSWLETMFHARGLITKRTTPDQHDRAMGIVQVLTHFSTEVMGKTLANLGIDIAETLEFTSPVYLIDLLMTARHFAQSPTLYRSIQMSNPDTARVTQAFVDTAESIRRVVTEKDEGEFHKMFEEVKDFFGSFTTQALEQSSFLIDRLVERG